MRPRYMTAVVSQICATTARSWLIKRKVTPASRSRSLMRFSVCAWTETSSADTGSPPPPRPLRADEPRPGDERARDGDALALPAGELMGMLRSVGRLEPNGLERG